MFWPRYGCPERTRLQPLRLASLAVCVLLWVVDAGVVHSREGSSDVDSVSHFSPLTSREQRRWISAIGNDRIDTLKLMLHRHQPDQLLPLTASNGKSALMVASKKGDLALVKSLIAAGASIEQRTLTNGSALMFAVLGNRRSVAEWLFEKGADIHVVGSNGWTALTLAAAKGHVELLQWLIENGADTEVRDVYRYTPLMRAVDNGQLTVATLLLTLPQTAIDAQDEYDNTSLHHAIVAEDAAMVQLLIEHGAAVDVPNRDGATATVLAADNSLIRSLLP